MKSNTRVAYHAGSWYKDDPSLLAKEIGGYLSKSEKLDQYQSLKSIIVPHAGYRFCGPTAGKSFININPSNYDRVVILGPSHHQYFQACGLTPFDSFETPFGDVNVDTKTINKLLGNTNLFFTLSETTDVKEHSIEMEMPFLKYIFDKKDFSLIPIMVGHNDFLTNTEIGKALYDLYEDPKTLFVISSDFCHWGRNFGFTYYNKQYDNIWESTQDLDKQALDIISEMNSAKLDEYFKKTRNTICGRNPITIVLSIIEKYKKNHADKKISFDTVGYSQSNKVKTMFETSVSYAAGVNFII
jgi:AmmeMemoRadiSam system protein B